MRSLFPNVVTPTAEDIGVERLRAERLRIWRERRERMEARPQGRHWRGRARGMLYRTANRTHDLLRDTWPVRWSSARAMVLELTDIALSFPDLPASFDGYRILHLTDLHLDNIEETAAIAAKRIMEVESDLCVITGDIRDNIHAPTSLVIERLAHLIGNIRPADGIFGILGNHDSAAMLAPMEETGIRMLVNETVVLQRGGERVNVTGLDDVHRFYTAEAATALTAAPEGFGIALVHSPEIADQASLRHRLYLTGHTHGGQICLPGRRPLATALRRHRDLFGGLWRHGDMVGYTSRGVGTCIVPFRMHCPGEVVVVTLRRGPANATIGGEEVTLW